MDGAQDTAHFAKTGEAVSQASWFDSDTIQRGEAWGQGGSHSPLIFVDLERGVFYDLCGD